MFNYIKLKSLSKGKTMNIFWEWLNLLINHWLLLLGSGLCGLFIFIISLIERIKEKQIIPKKLYLVMVIFILIMVASYKTWTDEYFKYLNLEKQITQEQSNFKIDPLFFGCGDILPNGSHIILLLKISNSGTAASIPSDT